MKYLIIIILSLLLISCKHESPVVENPEEKTTLEIQQNADTTQCYSVYVDNNTLYVLNKKNEVKYISKNTSKSSIYMNIIVITTVILFLSFIIVLFA